MNQRNIRTQIIEYVVSSIGHDDQHEMVFSAWNSSHHKQERTGLTSRWIWRIL